MVFNIFNKEKERPTAATADDRLSLVLSYQRSDIDERKLKMFQTRLIELCDEFGYDVVGEVEIRPQSRQRDNTTVLNASIPVRLRENKEEKARIPNRGIRTFFKRSLVLDTVPKIQQQRPETLCPPGY